MAADLFVLPAIYEPFGIVVLEAMAAGVPAVVSRSCGAAEGMRHRHDLVLLEENGSVEELVEAIREVRQDESLRRTMSEAGKIKAREFSWDLIATKMLGIYSEVMRSQ
jgi:glycosyltransferase involved in cell wall biosynthesis